jgi:hypothetical protein
MNCFDGVTGTIPTTRPAADAQTGPRKSRRS